MRAFPGASAALLGGELALVLRPSDLPIVLRLDAGIAAGETVDRLGRIVLGLGGGGLGGGQAPSGGRSRSRSGRDSASAQAGAPGLRPSQGSAPAAACSRSSPRASRQCCGRGWAAGSLRSSASRSARPCSESTHWSTGSRSRGFEARCSRHAPASRSTDHDVLEEIDRTRRARSEAARNRLAPSTRSRSSSSRSTRTVHASDSNLITIGSGPSRVGLEAHHDRFGPSARSIRSSWRSIRAPAREAELDRAIRRGGANRRVARATFMVARATAR